MEPIAELGRFDLILCRNVLIYFSGDTRKAVLRKLARALRPGGALIVGGAESLSDSPELFRLVEPSPSPLYTLAPGASS